MSGRKRPENGSAASRGGHPALDDDGVSATQPPASPDGGPGARWMSRRRAHRSE